MIIPGVFMEFALYLSNIDYVKNIDEVLRPVDYHNVPSSMIDTLFSDINSIEYYKHIVSLEYLQTHLMKNKGFSRLYFGQETCDYLISSLDELRKAYHISQQLGWDFTYVTGYVTDSGLEKTRRNLQFLERKGKNIEVVVNDFGVLSVMHKEFSSLQPVLGRLLVKQKRLARFSNIALPINMKRINVSIDEIAKNQKRILRELNFSIPSYRKELKRLGIRRVELDIVPQGVDIEPDNWGISFSCYYPWTYITSARTCATAAVNNLAQEYMVVSEPCPMICRKLNRSADLRQLPIAVLQRGNAIFAFTHKYAQPYLGKDIPINRLIFEPYIPI